MTIETVLEQIKDPNTPSSLHVRLEWADEIERLKEKNEKLLELLSEVAASMQVSPLRMELRGRIRAALNTEEK